MSDLDRLQQRLGHVFSRRDLLVQALTHPSYAAEHPGTVHNQRLEFLGDAVLQIIISDALYQTFPIEREGALSTMRSQLVQAPVLAGLARQIGLDRHLILSAGDDSSGGRERINTLSDAFEALIAAVYLDGGIEAGRRVILGIYGDLQARLSSLNLGEANPKGRLQERIQPVHGTGVLRYETVAVGGPDHAKEYTSTVWIAGRALGAGRGPSKKAAEEAAARAALAALASDL